MKPHGIGIVGCGNIAGAYLKFAKMFRAIDIRLCADINRSAADTMAQAHGVRAVDLDEIFEHEDIDVILNLTVPTAHYDLTMRALLAGKHVYSEKPFVLSLEEGRRLADLANARGLRLGSAPDTFLGGAHQLARQLCDSDAVGRIISGTCFYQSHGMEHVHPNPHFFFRPGGGPVLDIGPYYVSNLVQMLGSVEKVVAQAGRARNARRITSQPHAGEMIPVETPTTYQALLSFHSGALITLVLSWDVWQHNHNHIELYGLNGTLHVPDPDRFGGEVRLTRGSGFVSHSTEWNHPFARANDPRGFANYRSAGLADMMRAIDEGRPHRCSSGFALHVIDVLTGIQRAAETGSWINMVTKCTRPAPLLPEEGRAMLVNTQDG